MAAPRSSGTTRWRRSCWSGSPITVPRSLRLAALILSEAVVIGFFLVIAWYGWEVIVILASDRLTSLPWVPVWLTQSVIPVGSVLIALAEAVTIPERWREAQAGVAAQE